MFVGISTRATLDSQTYYFACSQPQTSQQKSDGSFSQPIGRVWITGRNNAFDLIGWNSSGQHRMPPSPYSRDCASEPCRNDSGAGQEAQKCAHRRNRLSTTDRLQFGSFASNEINDGVRAELLPFDLSMTKTLIQKPTSVEEIITTTSRSTA